MGDCDGYGVVSPQRPLSAADFSRRPLGFRDGQRSCGRLLPARSGPRLSRSYNAPPLRDTLLRANFTQEADPIVTSAPTQLRDHCLAPERVGAWLYILREPAVRRGGERLGQVGGCIVGEVLIGIISADPESHLVRA